jgi:hypothetical protein
MADTPPKIAPDPKPLTLGPRRPIRRPVVTREQVSHVLRRLAWVAPLTLLIWIYAERQQERRQTVTFSVDLAINTPDRVILGPTDRLVTAELKGPAAQLEAVKNKLLSKSGKAVITLPLDPSLSVDSHNIQTDLIAADPLFRTHAITVENTDPRTLTVYVDRVVDREVPVRVPPNLMNLLDGKPVFDPPFVHIRGPQSELQRVASDGMLDAFADLAGRESLKVPGIHEERAVPIITPLRGEHISVTPTKVNVTLKVRPADVTTTWSTMPIWINTPPGFADKYRVVLANPTLKDVHLTGPAETVAAMQQDSFRPKPKARLDVSNSDLPAGETRVKVVQFDDLPKGVAVAPPDANRTAEFKILDAAKE